MELIKTRPVREEPVYYLFMIILAAYFSYNYYLTFEFNVDASSSIPRLVIYFSLGIIALDFMLKLTPLRPMLEEKLLDDSESILNESGLDLDESLNLRKLLIEFLWVLGYCLGIYYIGFFTITAVYIFSYVFLKSSAETIQRRTIEATLFTVVLSVFVYILYIELMSVVSLYRLGPYM